MRHCFFSKSEEERGKYEALFLEVLSLLRRFHFVHLDLVLKHGRPALKVGLFEPVLVQLEGVSVNALAVAVDAVRVGPHLPQVDQLRRDPQPAQADHKHDSEGGFAPLPAGVELRASLDRRRLL